MNAFTYPGPDRRESERRALPAGFCEDQHLAHWERKKYEEKLTRVTAELATVRAALQKILDADESPAASGGEIWYAEAVYQPIGEARAALASIKQGGAE